MNNNNFKKIQILGNTQVCGYFAFCRLVNYENISQTKTIKGLCHGGIVGFYRQISNLLFLNVIHHDDIRRSLNIGIGFSSNMVVNGSSEGKQYRYSLKSNTLYGIPFDCKYVSLYSGNYVEFSSSNKSYAKYIYVKTDMIAFADVSQIISFSDVRNLNDDIFQVSFIDFCISTNIPLVMEYLGEIEVMQSDNKTDVNNSFFMINRYVENPL